MIKDEIQKIVSKAAKIEAEISVSENGKFGHYSSNAAMKIAAFARTNAEPTQNYAEKNPLKIAEQIVDSIKKTAPEGFFEKVETAAPGFVNFWISKEVLQNELKEILKLKGKYGQPAKVKPQNIQIEFISANPTGLLTIGNGRGGFFGDVLANLLEFYGHKVTKEYYLNDAKNSTQIKELGKTGLGLGTVYFTEDVKKKISKIKGKIGKLKIKNPLNIDGEVGHLLAREIHNENKDFIGKKLKIKFDKWFSEQSLYDSKAIDKLMAFLAKDNLTYEKEGAVWFRATQFGDFEDRVLVRSTGEPTYFLPDLAYHFNKFKIRKFDEVIDIWGADHHGYIPRLKAGLRALKIDDQKLKVIITQLVRLIKNGQEFKMSKRKGEFVTMDDLVKEIGLDAARFFFLMSAPDTHMNFDLDLAKERSMKNPVYYAQYAYVRSGAILKKAKNLKGKTDFSLLNTEVDADLMKTLAQFPEAIRSASENRNPQLVARYVLDLAKIFNNFYEKERIVTPGFAKAGKTEKSTALSRLSLVRAVNIIFKTSLDILGVSTPKKM